MRSYTDLFKAWAEIWPLPHPLEHEYDLLQRTLVICCDGYAVFIYSQALADTEAGALWFNVIVGLGKTVCAMRQLQRARELRYEILRGLDQRELPACLWKKSD